MSKYILKLARCIQELERIKGVQTGKGGDRKSMDKMSIDTPKITQEDIAKQFGSNDKMSIDQNSQITIETVRDNLSLTELYKSIY